MALGIGVGKCGCRVWLSLYSPPFSLPHLWPPSGVNELSPFLQLFLSPEGLLKATTKVNSTVCKETPQAIQVYKPTYYKRKTDGAVGKQVSNCHVPAKGEQIHTEKIPSVIKMPGWLFEGHKANCSFCLSKKRPHHFLEDCAAAAVTAAQSRSPVPLSAARGQQHASLLCPPPPPTVAQIQVADSVMLSMSSSVIPCLLLPSI